MKRTILSIITLLLLLSILTPTTVQAISLDEIFSGADDFIEIGESSTDTTINDSDLKDTSDLLYNILLGIGMVTAVVVGMVLGIKYMLAGSEEKADIKQTLPAYIVSCIVVFGAFGIWKLLINIIQ